MNVTPATAQSDAPPSAEEASSAPISGITRLDLNLTEEQFRKVQGWREGLSLALNNPHLVRGFMVLKNMFPSKTIHTILGTLETLCAPLESEGPNPLTHVQVGDMGWVAKKDLPPELREEPKMPFTP